MKKFKVNLHVCDGCNYRCRHCFAHFAPHTYRNAADWKRIIDNCLESGLADSFNFAGGEPMLYPELMDVVKYAHSKGAACSLITNGFLMTPEWAAENAQYFQTVGFSLDGFDADMLRNLGRATVKGEVLSLSVLRENIAALKAANPNIRIKVNTVVSACNCDENVAETLKTMPVDRWKILKMMPFRTEGFSNYDIEISDAVYGGFLRRNLETLGIHDYQAGTVLMWTDEGMEVVAEQTVQGTYIMVDAGGFLVDDTLNSNYVRIADLTETPFAAAMNKLTLHEELYHSRYAECDKAAM